jgi:plastocyanin
MTRIRGVAMTAAVGVAVALSACGNGPPDLGSAGGGSTTVGVAKASGLGTPAVKVNATSADQFNPGKSSAKVGQVVQWTVAPDSVPHNVTWDTDQSLNSPQTIGPGETWQVKFTMAGTYTYHCTIHPGMNGQITIAG